MPRISIVIPTCNAKDLLSFCLESIFKQTYRDFEIIVVDNGSKDGTQDYIRKNYPPVSLIKNKENLGASTARNQGIKASTGDWILSLDCDVILTKDFLQEMIDSINAGKQRVGMVGGKVYNEKKRIYTTGIILTKIRRFYDRGKNQADYGQFDRKLDIFGPSSAAALYKKEMLEELKIKDEYFDNDFFFLVEDVDLAWRANKLGWKGRFAPQALCFHHGDSSNTDRRRRQYLCFRNRYFLILKNESFLRLLIFFIPVLIFYELPRFFYLLLTNPHTLRILKDIKSHFKSMLEKRKVAEQIMRKKISISKRGRLLVKCSPGIKHQR